MSRLLQPGFAHQPDAQAREYVLRGDMADGVASEISSFCVPRLRVGLVWTIRAQTSGRGRSLATRLEAGIRGAGKPIAEAAGRRFYGLREFQQWSAEGKRDDRAAGVVEILLVGV